MSFEFLCTRCHSQLQVPEEIQGRKAQCPHCGEIQTVPQGTIIPPIPPASEFLPYNTPFQPDPSLFTAPSGLRPTQVQFSEMFQNTWNLFSARFVDFLLIGLVATGITSLFYGPAVVCDLLANLGADNESLRPYIPLFAVANIFFSIANSTVGIYLQLGGVRYAIHLARGGESRLSLMFPGLELFLKHLGASILVGLAVAAVTGGIIIIGVVVAGILMIGAGGNGPPWMIVLVAVLGVLIAMPIIIWLSIRLMWCAAFIADRNEGPIEAIGSSWQFSSGNVLSLFALMLVYGILAGAVAICTCGLGFLLFLPIVYCYTAVAYLMMTGQPLGAQQQ